MTSGCRRTASCTSATCIRSISPIIPPTKKSRSARRRRENSDRPFSSVSIAVRKLIVQVIKEGIGTKGPTLSSYISLPGRFLVMMPGMEQLGVSRKIEDDEKRRKMRDILAQLSLPKDMGFIVRTAGVDRPQARSAAGSQLSGAPLEESGRSNRQGSCTCVALQGIPISSFGRSATSSIPISSGSSSIPRASPGGFASSCPLPAPEVAMTSLRSMKGPNRSSIDSASNRKLIGSIRSMCLCPAAVSLVIEQTEAMVAVDVNSGRFRVHDDAEETAFRVNLEAVDEIARQLRLRDLGGLVVVDLIDMLQEKHRRTVERRLNDALKKHKERAKVLRISRFGLLEMTRQRQGPSLTRNMYRNCTRCNGSGRVKAPESVALDVMRRVLNRRPSR